MLSDPLRIFPYPLRPLLALLLGATSFVSAEVLSFEEAEPPACLNATPLARPTSERAKYGHQSLRWDWQSGSVLTFTHPIDFKPYTPEAESNALSTFVVWIYNETPSTGGIAAFS